MVQPYDDRDGVIWMDGELVDWRGANVHILTHALHYASSVFEGQRAYNGKIFELTRHSERLIKSAAILGMELPWTVEQLDAACIQVLEANNLTNAYMRPIAWRGSEQMGVTASKATPHVAIAAWEWGKYFDEEKADKGIRLDIAKYRRPAPHTAPVDAKAAGLYMICTISRQYAEANGYDDALMFDWEGRVAEATGANAFFVKNGELHTPTADIFLNGITRQTVIKLAKNRGINVIERRIWPEELGSFEECFLTGSAAEVTFVSEIGPWSFKPGDLSRQLRKDYDDLVNGRQVSA